MAAGLPGYFSFVSGEASPEEVQNSDPELFHIFDSVMYHALDTDAWMLYGLNRYEKEIWRVLKQLHPNMREDGQLGNWRSLFRAFYNRQLIVQMTSKPKRFDEHYKHPDGDLNPIRVPLQRYPAYEIQVDLMQLLPHQLENNFNWKYLVVIVDTFSRFVWAFPSATTESKKVASAFAMALSREGFAKTYYEFIREKVKRVLVDGGSEFKDAFKLNLQHVFPNASLFVSNPKRMTFGRPTNNAPIEAAIRTLRKALRDHEIGVDRTFYHAKEVSRGGEPPQSFPQRGLTMSLRAYQNAPQYALKGLSPAHVASQIAQNNDQLVNDLQVRMDTRREKKIKLLRDQRQLVGSRFLVTTPNEYQIYRLYVQPGAFAKEVDFRVSLETYYIVKTYDNERDVDLKEVDSGKIIRNRMSNLVLVKHPIYIGRPSILRNLKREYEENEFHAANKAQASRPYEVSEAIVRAVHAPALAGQPVGLNLPAHPRRLEAPAELGRRPRQLTGFHDEPVDNEPTRRSERQRRTVDRLTY